MGCSGRAKCQSACMQPPPIGAPPERRLAWAKPTSASAHLCKPSRSVEPRVAFFRARSCGSDRDSDSDTTTRAPGLGPRFSNQRQRPRTQFPEPRSSNLSDGLLCQRCPRDLLCADAWGGLALFRGNPRTRAKEITHGTHRSATGTRGGRRATRRVSRAPAARRRKSEPGFSSPSPTGT